MSTLSMSGLVLAVDQGTTNTKALLVNRDGRPVFCTSAPLTISTPRAGFVEQDPMATWQSVLSVIARAVDHARATDAPLRAIAISNQRETALAWRRSTGEALTPAMSWQCRRSSSMCDRFASQATLLRQTTGLPLDPVLSATKWGWALENIATVQRAAKEEDLCFGTVDSWLVYKLTGGRIHATDTTNASRTGLFNLNTLQWDDTLLDLFSLPAAVLPQVRPSAGSFGESSVAPVEGVPILAIMGDSHAALAGHGAFTPGAIKATYGTGSSLMTLTPSLAADTPDLARTIAWSTRTVTQYALEGNIFMTGSALEWVGSFLGLPHPAADAAGLAGTVDSAHGVYFVPAMVGLGAPHWRTEARGALSGLGREHTSAHMARAAIEAIAYQVADVFFAMRKTAQVELPELRADGAPTRNASLMQFQADVLEVPVMRSNTEELSALGAAYLAGLELGWWPSLQSIASLARETQAFTPAMPSTDRNRLYAGWRRAVAGVCSTAEVA